MINIGDDSDKSTNQLLSTGDKFNALRFPKKIGYYPTDESRHS